MFVYWRDTHRHGWELMSGVLLCITGVEAMYADLGHFSRRAVQVRALAFQSPLRCMPRSLNVRWRVDGHLTFLDLTWSRPDIPPGLLCGGISAGLLA